MTPSQTGTYRHRALLLLLTLPTGLLGFMTGCPGVESETSGGRGGASCKPDLASIQAAIFVPSCASAGCHAATDPAASLDLASADVGSRLIEAPSATCARTLVVPGNPELSFLYEKMTVNAPSCGERMPAGATLTAEQAECVRAWIAGLPAGCETCGGAGCVDLQTDPANCGGCGVACPGTAACDQGTCTCSGGRTLCGSACVDTGSDPANCGGCNEKCAPALVCSLGQCSSMCAGGLTLCGGACVDTTNNPDNCGACGTACGATGTCQASQCVCAGGGDTQTDPNNCGGCGNACSPGQTCEAGVCTCGSSTVSFAQAVQPILTASCATAGCHKGVMPQQGMDLSAGNAYGEIVGVAASECNDGRLRVSPGKPDQSYLLDKIQNKDLCSGTKMPKLSSLPAASVETIANWICGGALNN